MENVLQNPSVQRVSAKLKELGVKGEVHVLSDSARTAQEAADALGILVGQVASSIKIVAGLTQPTGDTPPIENPDFSFT